MKDDARLIMRAIESAADKIAQAILESGRMLSADARENDDGKDKNQKGKP